MSRVTLCKIAAIAGLVIAAIFTYANLFGLTRNPFPELERERLDAEQRQRDIQEALDRVRQTQP
ncbi:MAG: hypothetical protein DDT26_00129 [Dehalococcoidia bacterium]|nr:hypothetical protein [Chloroflexota bacterium]